jgi:hypothetical protein
LTDPHLFDAGKPSKKQTRTEAEKESAETLEAFEWALKQLNEPRIEVLISWSLRRLRPGDGEHFTEKEIREYLAEDSRS